MQDNGKNTAVTFVTDGGFLIPSIIAALQVVEQPAVNRIADVVIFTVDVEDATVAEIRRLFSERGLTFIQMPSDSFFPATEVHFAETHVPKTSLGRLAIDKFLPAQYQNIVYLDGDIQIAGAIEPLVNFRVPTGYVAAAPEFLWLTEGDVGGFWRKHKDYLNKLGIENPKQYFNAGVMAADRATWAAKSKEALSFFENNSAFCFYHDQSALNAVCRGSVKYLSPTYNFSTFYASLKLNEEISPNIIHFTGGGKPWNYLGSPWNGKFYQRYKDFIGANPSLGRCINLTLGRQSETGSALSRGREAALRALRLPGRRKALRKFMSAERFAIT